MVGGIVRENPSRRRAKFAVRCNRKGKHEQMHGREDKKKRTHDKTRKSEKKKGGGPIMVDFIVPGLGINARQVPILAGEGERERERQRKPPERGGGSLKP